MSYRTGSLFTGTSALDLAVMDVFDADVVWHSQYEPPDKNGKVDKNQYAAQILARHWPMVPNLGDITKVCWQCVLEAYGPVDILTGGFPCTDVSSAGLRAGLTADSRSGLWTHMARAIRILRPRLVIIENVEGLLSAPADRGLGLDAETLEEEARAGRILRALGAVLGDLASLGFDAEWARVAASEVGAPHPRKRVFVYAWQVAADPYGDESERGRVGGVLGGSASEELGEGDQRERSGHAVGDRGEAAADAADLGHERGGSARGRGDGPADGGIPVADADAEGAGAGREGAGVRGRSAVRREPSAADAARHAWGCVHGDGVQPGRGANGSEPAAGRGSSSDSVGVVREHDGELPPGRDPVRGGVRQDSPRCGSTAADAQGVGRGEGRPESAQEQGRPDAPLGGRATPTDTDSFRRRADILQLRAGEPDLDWGDYEPAIRRWEGILGRPAPWPTDTLGRLTPVFTEWMMGLPDGWVTCTPGLTKNAMAKALGNGVVPQQAAAAIRLLAARTVDGAVAS